MSRYGWRPYVSVAVRRAQAAKQMQKLRRKGVDIKPVVIEGRKIARSFWGAAWCDHLESMSDFRNRLPRGRTYVRNGSVCHLEISRGEINAKVAGSELYTVKIDIETLPGKKWIDVKKRCVGRVGSLLELLEGKLSKNVMSVVTDRRNGLFPLPKEISLRCSCPDWAVMCKHVAAVLYGVGARLDETPQLLFVLRGVDYEELIDTEVSVVAPDGAAGGKRIAEGDVADVFGIEIVEDALSEMPGSHRTPRAPGLKPTAGPPKGPTRTSKGGSVTGDDIARLRTRFGMSKRELARLLGISPASVGRWEKIAGTILLRDRTLAAFETVEDLTKREARRKLETD